MEDIACTAIWTEEGTALWEKTYEDEESDDICITQDGEDTVLWSVAPDMLSAADSVKLTVAESGGEAREFPLPLLCRGAVSYRFEPGKCYTLRLFCGDKMCAVATVS